MLELENLWFNSDIISASINILLYSYANIRLQQTLKGNKKSQLHFELHGIIFGNSAPLLGGHMLTNNIYEKY